MKVYLLTYYDPFERYAFISFNKAIEHFYNKFNFEQVAENDEEMHMMSEFIHTQTGKTIAEYIFSIQTPEEFNELFGEEVDIIALEVL